MASAGHPSDPNMQDPNKMGAPPAYSPGAPPGAYPPQPGYPPQAGYPPPQAGYPPQHGYPPPQPYAAPAPAMQQQSNVVVVGQPQPVSTVIVQRRGVNHALHCIITLFFWPWIIVWIILCITDDS